MNKRGLPAYLFGKTALSNLTDFIDGSTLFAFDLDGTLAPIVSDPDAIGIPVAVQKEIAILSKLAQVAVITGRSRSDALQRLSIVPHYVIGNHGAEGLPGWESRKKVFVRTVSAWQNQLISLLSNEDQDGMFIENKGPTLSIHYRHAGNINKSRALIIRVVNHLVPQPTRISGKYIENLIPPGAPDKGLALSILMVQAERPKAFFVGDDETDEDVFRLNNQNMFTVRVGNKKISRAQYHLRGQNEIGRLLLEINRILTHLKK